MSWRERAACHNHPTPDAWFADPSDTARIQMAKRTCLTCPVRRECAEFGEANGERWAIVAGYRTSIEKEWEQLGRYLGLDPDTRGPYKPRTDRPQQQRDTCEKCGAGITTRGATMCRLCSQGLIDGAPARARIQELRQLGMLIREIAAAAGIPTNSIGSILRAQYVTESHSEALLAVEVRGVGVPA